LSLSKDVLSSSSRCYWFYFCYMAIWDIWLYG